MRVEAMLRLIAGAFVAASVLLGMYVHPYFYWFTLFVGLNLFQSAFSGWCPMMAILKKAGVPSEAREAVMKPTIYAVAAAMVFLMAAQARAQSEIAPRASVSFLGGAASTEDVTGAVLGGSILFDINDRVGVEGETTYLDRGAGVDALSASGSLLVNLRPSHRRIVPYAAGGGGLYRASFDLNNGYMFGPWGSQFSPGATICAAPGTGIGPGAGFGSGMGICPAGTAGYIGIGQMPAFYGRRLGPMVVPDQGMWSKRAFTDPAATIGGGVRFHVSDRLMVRPDIRARFIFGDGDTYVMAVVVFNVGYRF